MEQLVEEVAPDALDWLGGFLPDLGSFFAGGVLIAFFFWVVGYTVQSVFVWLRGR